MREGQRRTRGEVVLRDLHGDAGVPVEDYYRGLTSTLKVCRIIAFYRYWAIILLTFEGVGNKIEQGSLKGFP